MFPRRCWCRCHPATRCHLQASRRRRHRRRQPMCILRVSTRQTTRDTSLATILRMAITRLRTTCQRRRSLLPPLLTRRPQSLHPRQRPLLPRPPSPSPPQPCLPPTRSLPRGVHPRPLQPKGVPKARRGDAHHRRARLRRASAQSSSTTATRTSSLPSEATVTETTWRPITPRLALQCLSRRGSQPRLTWARCKLTSWRRTSGARRGRRASNPCITRSKSAGCTLRCRRRRSGPDSSRPSGRYRVHLTLRVWVGGRLGRWRSASGRPGGSRYSRGSRRVPAPLPAPLAACAIIDRTSPPVYLTCILRASGRARACAVRPRFPGGPGGGIND